MRLEAEKLRYRLEDVATVWVLIPKNKRRRQRAAPLRSTCGTGAVPPAFIKVRLIAWASLPKAVHCDRGIVAQNVFSIERASLIDFPTFENSQRRIRYGAD
jgi:hypothetical protein